MKALNGLSDFARGFASLSWQVFLQAWRRPYYYRLIIKNMYDFGFRSLFIIAALGISLGVVLTLHFGISAEKYGAKLYIPRVIALAIFGEVATVLTVIILAGRIGAGIASEIGAMKVTEQIDAIRALGVSHIKRVVVPKVIACVVIIPILCLVFSVISLATSAYVGMTRLSLDPVFFVAKALYTPKLVFFIFGILKTVIFAFCIAITSCHYGLSVPKSSYEVGRAAMRAVVASFALVIVGDLLLTKFYYSFLHW